MLTIITRELYDFQDMSYGNGYKLIEIYVFEKRLVLLENEKVTTSRRNKLFNR